VKYHPLLRKVVRLQREKRLIPKGSRLLLAFSGGIDSVALALAMIELRDFFGIKGLALAHINHGIRGQEALRDEEFCVKFAERHKLEIFVERLELKREGNLEALARQERYRALREIKQRHGFDLIATAHHLNDLVETVLLWLVRGAGMEGLLGFDEREGDVIRPMYLVKREEIEDFVRSRGEAWVEDSTNYDLRFARNRIRHKVVPELKAINPNLEESFLRLRQVLKEENDFLKELTQKVIKDLLKGDSFDRKAFLKLPKAIQRRVIYELKGIRSYKEVEREINQIKRGHLKSNDGGLF